MAGDGQLSMNTSHGTPRQVDREPGYLAGGDRASRLIRERAHAHVILASDERHWGWEGPAGRIRWQRRVDLLTGNSPGNCRRVLEIGTGTGTFTEVLASRFPFVASVDIAPAFMAHARRRAPSARLVLADAHDPCFADETFDRVVGCSVLHHLDWDDALAGVFRVLRPGGSIAFSEPNLANPQIFLQKNWAPLKRRLGDSPDEYAFTSAQIHRSLERSGFTDIRVVPYEFLHPSTPEFLIPLVVAVEKWLQPTPIAAVAGSLRIEARRPGSSG
jgi:SAM-dependent methyltransferase